MAGWPSPRFSYSGLRSARATLRCAVVPKLSGKVVLTLGSSIINRNGWPESSGICTPRSNLVRILVLSFAESPLGFF
ncbi:hypothetical protein HNR65_003054 [Desulfosalsimonas propionicica]|uniref:Uncharacterized protein n=1 Tax=Desulfosalsimonas propionicica TaxID=332175 RepID=A0A7W0CBJ5_9BACT|nr:hypothetical protein [Desulfosalsimonas propionicica]